MIEGEDKARKYVLATAQLLDLTIDDQYVPKVVENWESIAKIASLVTEFDLAENIESVAIFQPEEVIK